MHVLPSVCSAGKVHTSAPLSLRLPQGLWQWAWLPWHITAVFTHTYVPPFPFPFVAFQPWRVNCYCITCMGEEKKLCASDFYLGAGDIWNVNWSVGSFASPSVDTGSVFRVRSVLKFLLESVMFSDHWEFELLLALQFFLGLLLLIMSPLVLIMSPLRTELPLGRVAPLQVTERTARLADLRICETLESPNFLI